MTGPTPTMAPLGSTDPAAVRASLVAEGYAYLPGLLPAATAGRLAAAVEAVLTDHGWRPGSATVAVPFPQLYRAVQELELLHTTVAAPALADLAAAMLGEPVFRHPAAVLRLALPRPNGTPATRPHQDFVVQHVSADAITCWVALTRCDRRAQGLVLRPRSHLAGFRPPARDVGGARPLYLAAEIPAAERASWITADFQPGDVVMFHSFTVHAGGANLSDQVRLSLDFRYQPVADPILEDHVHPHGWPQVPDWPMLSAQWRDPAAVPAVPPQVRVLPSTHGRFDEALADLRPPPSRLLATVGGSRPDAPEGK